MQVYKSVRNRLPAMGLGLALALGMTAGAVTLAPAALAQAAKPEFGNPLNEAKAAMQAKNWTLATQKIDQAAPHAKSSADKKLVMTFRLAAAQGSGNKASYATALENAINSGLYSATEVKSYRRDLMSAYQAAGQKDKSMAATAAYIKDFGGDEQLYLVLASDALKARDYTGAIDNGNKAIDMARKAGRKPKQEAYNIVQKALYDSKKMDAYYSMLEKVVTDYPNENNWKTLINSAQKAQGWNPRAMGLERFRLLSEAKVKLSPSEKVEMSKAAEARYMFAETESVLKQFFGPGGKGEGLSEADKAKAQRTYELAVAEAKKSKAALPTEETAAVSAGDGLKIAEVAEKNMVFGNTAKAVELFTAAIPKITDPGQADLARLRLGIAQYRSGKAADARKTWETVKTNAAASALARGWIAVSKI